MTAAAARLAALAETRSVLPHAIRRAMELARGTAGRWHLDPEDGMEREDLRSVAYIGAWRGCLTYQPGRGAAWETWIVHCCKSEIQEALRHADVLTRIERRRHREALKEDPLAQEPRAIVPFSQMSCREDSEESERLEWVEWVARREAGISLMETQIFAADEARRALRSLPNPRARQIVQLLAVEGWLLYEVAALYGLSTSRIYQIWRDSRRLMRAALEEER